MLLKMLYGTGPVSFGSGMIILLLVLPFIYYLYMYPIHLRKRYEMETGSEIVSMVLYIAMYMRNTPSLEGAVRFAAENVTGNLGYELKKIMWDIHVGNYLNMEEALIDYSRRWKNNREFVEAIDLVITSLRQTGERRVSLLNEAVTVILEGNRDRTRHFNQKLRMPVLVVHALGIILPVLGLVIFPLVSIFLGVGPLILFIGYDVILPLQLLFVITNILETRPATFSKIDISENPDVPPEGKFFLGKKPFPAWIPGFAVIAASSVIGFLAYISEPKSLLASMIIIGGLSFGLALYYTLLTFQRMSVREKTREIETEFAEALFQMGNQIYTGLPVETSVSRSVNRSKNLKIRELFSRALNNMRTLGMTFRQAFFDKNYGAVRFFPSRLIKSVMRTIVESSEKGARSASLAMLAVSEYLRGLHRTQEEIREELSEPLSSMKFQTYFLSPLISGVVVTLTIVMLEIIDQLLTKVGATGAELIPFFNSLKNVGITEFEFTMVVGIYLVESAFVLGMFINGIENGEDRIGRQHTTAQSLVIGFIVFVVTLSVTLYVFKPLVSGVVP